MSRTNVRPAIEEAHSGNLEAIRADLRSGTRKQIAAKYGRTHWAVKGWEKIYGVECLRACPRCGAAPQPDQECETCDRCRERRKESKRVLKLRHLKGYEFQAVDPALFEHVKRRWGKPGDFPLRYYAQGGAE